MFMSNLEQGFAALGRPQTYAVEQLKAVTHSHGISPRIKDGVTELMYINGTNTAAPSSMRAVRVVSMS